MRYSRSPSRVLRKKRRAQRALTLGKVLLAGIFLTEFALAFMLGRCTARERSTPDARASDIPALAPPSGLQAEPSQRAKNALYGESQNSQDDHFLILVNWEHPISAERPEDLVRLDSVFGDEVVLVNPDGSIQKDAAVAAREMFLDAQEEGVGPYKLTGAYRSVQYQDELFRKRKESDAAYGENPYENPVKVLPGACSEHATGLALDILSASYEESNREYANTPEGEWLLNHAHEYGFILRYPQNKEYVTGVIYEPWHYRYVGRQAAEKIHEQNICLEEYLDFTP